MQLGRLGAWYSTDNWRPAGDRHVRRHRGAVGVITRCGIRNCAASGEPLLPLVARLLTQQTGNAVALD